MPQVDDHDAFREGLLRHYHKQSSAVNLSRMANPAELRRLQDDLRCAALLAVYGCLRRV